MQYEMKQQQDMEINKIKDQCRELENKLRKLEVDEESIRMKYVQEMN